MQEKMSAFRDITPTNRLRLIHQFLQFLDFKSIKPKYDVTHFKEPYLPNKDILTLQSPVVTTCTTCLTIYYSAFCPQSVLMGFI
jgi:hypothetical protein